MADLEKKPKYKLYMEVEDGNKTVSLNNKRCKLLQCIDKYGSILKASKETRISYRTALKDIEIMEMELGLPIVVTKRGGKGGGGSSELTDAGKQILFKFIKINKILKNYTDLNEIKGIVSAIDKEKKIMKIALDKKEIILPISKNFNIEDKVLISISPSNIFVIPEPGESSVINILEGIITEMRFKNDAVRLNVNTNGNNIVVDITEFSRKELDLNPGKRIFIGFNATSVDIIKKEI